MSAREKDSRAGAVTEESTQTRPAEKTARGWEDYADSAFAHFEQLKQKLDRTDPSYKE